MWMWWSLGACGGASGDPGRASNDVPYFPDDDSADVDSGAAADLTLSGTSYDMGVVDVGCVSTLELVLTNSGDEELVVSSLSLTNGFEFTIDDGAGAAPLLPIHIPAGLGTTIDVVFTPTTAHSTSTTLEIVSNDALAPTASV